MQVFADGEIEASFDISRNESVTAVAESHDGTVWVGFEFSGVDRYGPDGRFQDRTLKPARGKRLVMLPNENLLVGGPLDPCLAMVSTSGVLNAEVSANAVVRDMFQQADGKILLAGNFTIVNGYPRPYVARLNADGSLDQTFQPPLLIGQALQPQRVSEHTNGAVVVAGEFDSVTSVSQDGIARFNRFGEFDTTFNPGASLLRGSNYWRNFKGLRALPSGDLVIAAIFQGINGGDADQVVRLNDKGEVVKYWV